MVRILKIAVLSCACLAVAGCNGHKEDEPIWEKVKIWDLAPSKVKKRAGGQLLKTINFDVHVFEIPDANDSKLDDVWQKLSTQPLRFSDNDAFKANSFSAGFGQVRMWNEIGELLSASKGRKLDRVSLLLFDEQADGLFIAGLHRKQDVFYVPKTGPIEGVSIGPGKLILRMTASRIGGSRGVCRVGVVPAFSPPRAGVIAELAAREKAGEFAFESAGFNLKMSPGDFIFLGPTGALGSQKTLAGLFFGRPDGGSAVRVYVIVCTSIVD